MAHIVITRHDQPPQEVQLRPGRMTLGRHADNDIVLEHRAVSGRHAAFVSVDDAVHIEDLASTNGTLVNGRRIATRQLTDGDSITVAKFSIVFHAGADAGAAATDGPLGSILVQNGPNAGKSLVLTKPVSTLGRPGVQVVAITRRGGAYFIHHVEGASAALLNGTAATGAPQRLNDGDSIELAGAVMRFQLQPY